MRHSLVESLRVLKVCRKTAVQARRIALQMIPNTIVCAPAGLRDTSRKMTRMQLIRTLAAWRPDLTAHRDVEEAYRIALKSLARELIARHSIGLNSAAQLLLTAGDYQSASNRNPVLLLCVVSALFQFHLEKPYDID